MTQIDSLLQKRESARAAAHNHASTATIIALRKEAVSLVGEGKPDAATKLFEQRDALKDSRDSMVRALSEEIAVARRVAREAAAKEAAAALEDKSVEELETLRARLTQERKALKQRMGAVCSALAKKQASQAMTELWAKLSPEERTALLASVGDQK